MSTKTAHRNRLERSVQQLGAGRAHERRFAAVVWIVVGLVLAGIVTAMLLSASPESSETTRTAPDFTLTDTNGDSVGLSDFRGENVVLYFSEGAGCQSCLYQMDEIEKRKADFDKLGVTVLPIVMNTREQIVADMELNDVQTPFLLDDGTVSDAYGTLGKGMHAGLPGHSFVLIDPQGQQRWYGEFPSMWLAPDQLLAMVERRLES